jgi:hypothetical protein
MPDSSPLSPNISGTSHSAEIACGSRKLRIPGSVIKLQALGPGCFKSSQLGKLASAGPPECRQLPVPVAAEPGAGVNLNYSEAL